MTACGHGNTSPSLSILTFTDIHAVVEAEAIKGALSKRQCIVLTSHGGRLGQMTGDCDLARKTKTKAQGTRGVFIPGRRLLKDSSLVKMLNYASKKARTNSGRRFVMDVRRKWPADTQSARLV